MKYKNIKWKLYKGVLMPEVPQHQSIDLSKGDQRKLLKLSNARLIRWIREWDVNDQTNYWYIIKDEFNGMSDYSSNTRNQIRKGLKSCEVRKIDHAFLMRNGYNVYKSAFSKYKGVNKIPSENDFKNTYEGLDLKSEFWGVFEIESKKMIAFAENQIRDKGVIYGSMKFDPNYLKKYPSYALIHTMDEYYLDKLKMKYVSDGPRSVLHETKIQEMLQKKFKYRKAYCELELAYPISVGILISFLKPFKKILEKINHPISLSISALLKLKSFTH
jgi:hypothetical protein